jgi:5-methylcytosine-specific restriction protein A
MHPGCPRPAWSGSLCDIHAKEKQKELDAARLTPADRGYGNRWRIRRNKFLKKHPLCADPDQVHTIPVKSTDVDHIIPKKNGGTDDEGNLQALCHTCHSRKTARSDGRWRHNSQGYGG